MAMKQVLVEYAATIADDMRADLTDPNADVPLDRDQVEHRRSEIDKRLKSYESLMEAAKTHEPVCPQCWMESGPKSVMKPIAGGDATPAWTSVDAYSCNRCGLRYPLSLIAE